jgi:hypothetical protein
MGIQLINIGDSSEVSKSKINESLIYLNNVLNGSDPGGQLDNDILDLIEQLQTDVSNLQSQLDSLKNDEFQTRITSLNQSPSQPIGFNKWYISSLNGFLTNFNDKFGRRLYLGKNQIHFIFSRNTYFYKVSVDLGANTKLESDKFQLLADASTVPPVSPVTGDWWTAKEVATYQFKDASAENIQTKQGVASFIVYTGTPNVYELQEAATYKSSVIGSVETTSEPTGDEREGEVVFPTEVGTYPEYSGLTLTADEIAFFQKLRSGEWNKLSRIIPTLSTAYAKGYDTTNLTFDVGESEPTLQPQLIQPDSALLNNFTIGSGVLTVGVTGIYKIDYQLQGIDSGSVADLICGVTINGTLDTQARCEKRTRASHNTYNFSDLIKLTAGQTVGVEVRRVQTASAMSISVGVQHLILHKVS